MDRLQHRLDELTEQLYQQMDQGSQQVYQQNMAALRAGNYTSAALSSGKTAPDFTLPSHLGHTVNLYQLLDQGPVILNFFRGNWCDYCALELRAYQKVWPRIQQLGGHLLSISPQPAAQLSDTASQMKLGFPLLSDPGLHIARRYGIAYLLPEAARHYLAQYQIDLPTINQTSDWQLDIPATYVLGRDRRIHFGFVDIDYRQRLDPVDAMLEMKKLLG